jgi:hypothetical protein
MGIVSEFLGGVREQKRTFPMHFKSSVEESFWVEDFCISCFMSLYLFSISGSQNLATVVESQAHRLAKSSSIDMAEKGLLTPDDL